MEESREPSLHRLVTAQNGHLTVFLSSPPDPPKREIANKDGAKIAENSWHIYPSPFRIIKVVIETGHSRSPGS